MTEINPNSEVNFCERFVSGDLIVHRSINKQPNEYLKFQIIFHFVFELFYFLILFFNFFIVIENFNKCNTAILNITSY